MTGELARMNVGPASTDGRRIEADLWLQPGAAVAGAHRHEHFVERFEVLAGEVGFQLGGVKQVSRPGDGVIEVGTGTLTTGGTPAKGLPTCASRLKRPRTSPVGPPLALCR